MMAATAGIQMLPPQASSVAAEVDWLFFALLGLSALICIVLFVFIWTFSVRYWHSREAKREAHEPGIRLELAWTIIPLLIFIGLFAWGGSLYLRIEQPPADALQINGLAKQWMWKFEHAGGQREINALHVPLGRAVVVTLVSQDVIHSFYVPAFRIKQDVLPFHYTRAWFVPSKTGRYPLRCAEYCGTNHAEMNGEVVVMQADDYQDWLERRAAAPSVVAQGAQLFRAHGCSGCHAPGSTVHAPPLEGLYGRTVQLAGGGAVLADESYIRDSILLPDRQVAAGYPALMPSFEGQISEADLFRLVAYVKSLADDDTREEALAPGQ